MADEKVFTIPLRDAFEVPKTNRTKKAINIVKAYLKKHTKVENVKIGKSINEEMWKRGVQKPPRKVKIHATIEDKTVYAEVIGIDIKTPTVSDKKKKEEKKKEKEKKIKEDRKDRRKQTIQEELEEGATQKAGPQEETTEKKQAEKIEKTAEKKQESKEKKAVSQATS